MPRFFACPDPATERVQRHVFFGSLSNGGLHAALCANAHVKERAMPFLLDAWYVAAWPNEVAPGEILARTVCGQPMVFFRPGEGRIAALEDRCCHRQMPLSQGWLEGANLRCGYHGMLFNGD